MAEANDLSRIVHSDSQMLLSTAHHLAGKVWPHKDPLAGVYSKTILHTAPQQSAWGLKVTQHNPAQPTLSPRNILLRFDLQWPPESIVKLLSPYHPASRSLSPGAGLQNFSNA